MSEIYTLYKEVIHAVEKKQAREGEGECREVPVGLEWSGKASLRKWPWRDAPRTQERAAMQISGESVPIKGTANTKALKCGLV